MIIDSLTTDRRSFEQGTGWELKPEGACKGEVCIPLTSPPQADLVDVADLAAQLNLPVVHDEAHGIWAIGPDSIGSRALATAVAPNLTLPDVDGELFQLDSLRGSKVLLVAWSPY